MNTTTISRTAVRVVTVAVTATIAGGVAYAGGLAARDQPANVIAATRIETAVETAFDDRASLPDRAEHLDPAGRAAAAIQTLAQSAVTDDNSGYHVDVTEVRLITDTSARSYGTLTTPAGGGPVVVDVERGSSGDWTVTDTSACSLLYELGPICDGVLGAPNGPQAAIDTNGTTP